MATGDRSRQALTLTAAAAQVLLPTLWGPRFAEDEQPPNVIQPAPYTFGVWLPIFASSLGYAGLQARRTGRDSKLMRAIGWPLAGAFASTGVWAPLVRIGKYWSAQAALAAIAAFAETARRRVARAQPPESDRAVNATSTLTAGMLAAWGITATGVNLASMLDPTILAFPAPVDNAVSAGHTPAQNPARGIPPRPRQWWAIPFSQVRPGRRILHGGSSLAVPPCRILHGPPCRILHTLE